MRRSRAWRSLIERLQERSTWGHIITAATAITGMKLTPEHTEMWTMAGLIVSTIIGVLTKER